MKAHNPCVPDRTQDGGMNIGEAAAQSGLTPKTIRAYERLGLLRPCSRTSGGYRTFSEMDLHVLRFIGRARVFGFGLPAIRELLALWQDKTCPSARVKALTLEHIARIDAKIRDLLALKATLDDLVAHSTNDQPGHPRVGPPPLVGGDDRNQRTRRQLHA